MYLFEDAELKTIFNMAELVKELEPEPLIETEDTDPSAGEEKRKIISQMASYSVSVLAICLLPVYVCHISSSPFKKYISASVPANICDGDVCILSCVLRVYKGLDHVENVGHQGHQLPHNLLWGLHLQLRGQHRVCGGADTTSSGLFIIST